MVMRDTPWPPGTPCWVDLSCDDVAAAKTFYVGLFGWQANEGPPEAGGYMVCELGGRPVAGIGPKMGSPEVPNAWTTYLATEDADLTAGKIKASGGQVMAEPFDVLDVGRMAVGVDPAGAVFGIWQARSHTGFGLANEPGAVCWNENMSRSFEANQAFYAAVFGYQYDPMGDDSFRYATFKTTGDVMGGIGQLDGGAQADVPPHWLTYFGVADTDAAIATLTGLGGSVIRPAWDTPFGRMAIVSDNQGAAFAMISVAQGSAQ
jgi:uncharacterized protein